MSPNTLRARERRFGYPRPQRSAARHRLYTPGEVTARVLPDAPLGAQRRLLACVDDRLGDSAATTQPLRSTTPLARREAQA